MDSEHRHELQQNELREALTHWRDMWDKYGTHLLLVVLILLAGFVFIRWYGGRNFRADEAAFAALADNATAQGKKEVAEEFEHVPGLAGLAYLQAADLSLRDALVPAAPESPTAPPVSLTPDQVKAKLNDAAALYEKVIALKQAPLQVINAHMGLASVHESLGNFKGAREQYDAAIAAAGSGWPTLAAQAVQLRDSLDRIAAPVTFAKTPPKPAASDKPATDKPAVPEFLAPPEKPATPEAPAPSDKPATPETPAPSDKPAAPEAPAPSDKPAE